MSRTNQDNLIENVKPRRKQMITTNKNMEIGNIKTVMKVLSTKPNNNKHRLNG